MTIALLLLFWHTHKVLSFSPGNFEKFPVEQKMVAFASRLLIFMYVMYCKVSDWSITERCDSTRHNDLTHYYTLESTINIKTLTKLSIHYYLRKFHVTRAGLECMGGISIPAQSLTRLSAFYDRQADIPV